jgi:hypothetical protein
MAIELERTVAGAGAPATRSVLCGELKSLTARPCARAFDPRLTDADGIRDAPEAGGPLRLDAFQSAGSASITRLQLAKGRGRAQGGWESIRPQAPVPGICLSALTADRLAHVSEAMAIRWTRRVDRRVSADLKPTPGSVGPSASTTSEASPHHLSAAAHQGDLMTRT